MSERPVPEVLDELRFDRSRAAPPDAAERVRLRVEQSIAHLASDGGDRAASRRRRATFTRAALLVAASLLLAGGVGAAIHAVFAPRARAPETSVVPTLTAVPKRTAKHRSSNAPAPETELADEVAAPSEAAIESPIVAPPGEVVSPIVVPLPAPVAHADSSPKAPEPRRAAVRSAVPADSDALSVIAVPPAPATSELSAERALLDRARTAFSSGRFAEAEQALNEHTQSFASGQLAEEREALLVRTLAGAGQVRAARDRAALFQQRYPHSFFASAVERAVRTNP